MEFPTAADMRKRTAQAVDNEFEKQRKMIQGYIDEASKKGEYETYVLMPKINSKIELYYKNIGYKVCTTYDKVDHEYKFLIKW